MVVMATTRSSSEGSTTDRFVSLGRCLTCCHCHSVSCVQELDIQDLQRQLYDRDSDFEELQQQWNLQNFKFCLLVDMVSGDTLVSLIMCLPRHWTAC